MCLSLDQFGGLFPADRRSCPNGLSSAFSISRLLFLRLCPADSEGYLAICLIPFEIFESGCGRGTGSPATGRPKGRAALLQGKPKRRIPIVAAKAARQPENAITDGGNLNQKR